MSQVFSQHGQAIPVSVIEVQPNVVSAVLETEKHGYQALQLGAFDRKKSTHKKPLVGHFAKANTVPKKFVREIRDMEGYQLGDQVDSSIFQAGELVDVTGISKGKGFAGAIKRHNQRIGPKSHGGGGGSKPVRQTGSLGDISGNKVIKGMNMPGHMGHQQVTVQNLEVISSDPENDLLLVKGSIPGPTKGYVLVRQAVKGLKNRAGVELVNVQETILKNKLLEEAKKVGAEINTDMSVKQMREAIAAAEKVREQEEALSHVSPAEKKLRDEIKNLTNEIDQIKELSAKQQSEKDHEGVKSSQTKLAALEKLLQEAQAKLAKIAEPIVSPAEPQAKSGPEKEKEKPQDDQTNDESQPDQKTPVRRDAQTQEPKTDPAQSEQTAPSDKPASNLASDAEAVQTPSQDQEDDSSQAPTESEGQDETESDKPTDDLAKEPKGGE